MLATEVVCLKFSLILKSVLDVTVLAQRSVSAATEAVEQIVVAMDERHVLIAMAPVLEAIRLILNHILKTILALLAEDIPKE